MPDYSKPFELIADACGFGIGAAPMQEGHPIAYMCRKFSPAEQNYTVGEQELLAVVDAMRTWRCYLEGVNADMFTVVTDHNPLTYLQSQSVLSRRKTRWSEDLQMFTFKWLYRPGKSNVADLLSRSLGVLAAVLPVDGHGKCAAAAEWQRPRWPWSQTPEVIASVAAVTCSQVSQLLVNELPASEAECGHDSSVQEAVHVAALSPFQKRRAAAYEKDPAFHC